MEIIRYFKYGGFNPRQQPFDQKELARHFEYMNLRTWKRNVNWEREMVGTGGGILAQILMVEMIYSFVWI